MAKRIPKLVMAASVVILASSCGSAVGNDSGDGKEEPTDRDCVPGQVAAEPVDQPDRRIEEIIEVLTGERHELGDGERVEEKITDPNFGGVWGDFQGGVVVAVLDCSVIDVEAIARIAGGASYLHLIEVKHTWREVEDFRDNLADELDRAGVEAVVSIASTLNGRVIQVQVREPDQLPSPLAPGVPQDAYVVIRSETIGTAPAG